MIKVFINKSKFYLISLFVLFLMFVLCKYFFMSEIIKIDNSVMSFVQKNIVSNSFTSFFKIVTNAGGVTFFVIVLIFVFLFFKDKSFFSGISFSLIFTYLVSVLFKNVFRRERPLFNLIDKPSDFSFPSGHTMCSVAFFGFIIYLVHVNIKNRVFKYLIEFLLVLLILTIAFSRIYLNIHFLSDVIGGFILGIVCLLMVVNYVKIER